MIPRHFFVGERRKNRKIVRARWEAHAVYKDLQFVPIEVEHAWQLVGAYDRDTIVLCPSYGSIADIRNALERAAAAGVRVVDQWNHPERTYQQEAAAQ